MTWPLSQDYNEAIQTPKSNFADPDLRRGEAATNALGLPMPFSGNFADVYQVRCPDGKSWAVKCFTRQAEGLRERYQEISRHLRQAKLPFIVDFTYLEQGIRVAGMWYPILKMQWVEGLTLNQFVAQSLDKPAMLEALSQVWGRMARHMRAEQVGHCDLQHGNVLMVPGASANSLALKLIDYDGMWVPALAGTKSGEVGHPCYQHPRRLREGTYSIEVDRFPLLLIATSLRALKMKGKALWEKYDNGDNLLFKEADLREPGASELFRELPQLGDPLTAALTGHMLEALGARLESTPFLEEVMPGARVGAARSSRPTATNSKTSPAVAPVVAGVAPVVAQTPAQDKTFAFDDSDAAAARASGPALKRARAKAAEKRGGLPGWAWAAGAAAALVLIGGAAAAFLATRGSAPDKQAAGPPVAQNQPPVNHDKEPAKPADGGPGLDTPVTPTPVKEGPGPDTPVTPTPVKEGPQPPAVAARSDPDGIDPDPKGPPGEVRHFDANPAEIRRLAVSPDGRQVLTASWDNAVRLWDVASGKVVLTCTGHTDKVHGVAFLPDGLRAISVGDDKTVRLWDLKDGHEIRSFSGHTLGIWHVAVSKDGRVALSCGPEDNAFLWDIEGDKELYRLHEPGGIESAAFSPDGQTVLTGGIKGTLRLWEVKSAREIKHFDAQPRDLIAVAFSPDGKYAVYGGQKGASLLRISDGKVVRTFQVHAGAVHGVAISPDGREILTGGEDGTVRVWDADTGDELGRLQGHQGNIESVAFSPGGHYGFSGGADNVVRMWRLPPAPALDLAQQDKLKGVGEIRKFEGHTEIIRRLSVSQDGKQLLTGGFDKTLRLWDVATSHELQRCEVPAGQKITGVAFLPDGRRALSCCNDDKAVHLWDLTDGRQIRSYVGHAEPVCIIAATGDGRIAASAGTESTVFLWDVETGKEIHRLEGNTAGVESLAFSPDGKLLLTGSRIGPMRLWDVETGKEVRRLVGHSGNVMGMAFSPDGRFAVSCGLDKTISVWQMADGREVRRFEGVTYAVWGVAVSADGSRILSANDDGTMRLWDAATGKEVYRFSAGQQSVWDVAFTPDGRYAFSCGNAEKLVRMWRLPPADYVPPPAVVKKPEPKPEPPAADALNAADLKVKDAYKDDFKKKKKEEVRALADKLEKDAAATKDPAARYVLLREARDAAARADDLTFAFHVADEMADGFAVDPLAMKLEALKAVKAGTPLAYIHVGVAALAIAEEAVDRDDYDTADRAVKAAGAAASYPPLEGAVQGRAKEVEDLRAAYTEAVQKAAQTLIGKPDDPEANLTLGKFLCLEKGDWNRGLPMLAEGSDPSLKALALSDLASVSDPDAQQEVAKAYATRAEGENGAAKAQLLRRACYWLQKAQAQLAPVQRTEVAKKLTELEKGILPQLPQRLAVVCAYYGSFNDWQDVTDNVRLLLVKSGRKLTVKADAGELGVPDHDDHQAKTLVVVYQCGGQTCLSLTSQGGTATIPAAPGAADVDGARVAPGQEVAILAARYGAEGTYGDLTPQLQHVVRGAGVSLHVDDGIIGDPFPGKSKALLVVYRTGNRTRLCITAQNQTAVIGEVPPTP